MTKFEQDKIGREEIVNRICLLVDNLQKDQHFCLALNGEWGSGKSFVLEYIEEELQKHEEYIVVKYDAWKNSFYQDPLIAILYCILDSVKEYFYYVDTAEKKFKRVAKFLKGSLQQFLDRAMGKTTESPDIETKKFAIGYYAVKKIAGIIKEISVNQILNHEKLADFKSYQDLLNKAQDLLNEIADYQMYEKKQTKLIILVDEIDRCLPDEQLKILERLHHLFEVKNCAVICALNKTSIGKAFKKIYDGEGSEYLRKFFDYTIEMEIEGERYLDKLFKEDLQAKLNKKFTQKKLIRRLVFSSLNYIKNSIVPNDINLNNRAINRYYNNLICILENLGWANINANDLFFIIVGLFIRQFIRKAFLFESKAGKGLYDYIKYVLALEAKQNSNNTSGIDIYKDKYLNSFNITANHLSKQGRWNYYTYGSDILGAKKGRVLKQLMLTYGGQDEYNER
ncbi:MAG: hypothetical protein E7380_03065 [Clostridiales bacterium]|nr:hypothetical protein [Clostridiales bacterium]